LEGQYSGVLETLSDLGTPQIHHEIIHLLEKSSIKLAEAKANSFCVDAKIRSIIHYVTENSGYIILCWQNTSVGKTTPLAKRLRWQNDFLIHLFWKNPFEGLWKHCRICKLLNFHHEIIHLL
jgi:hypothetical protein